MLDSASKAVPRGVSSCPEYFLHDPLGEYLEPRLQGFRLVRGRYQPLKPAVDGALQSAVTGLTLRNEDGQLRLIDTATGEPLLRIPEVQAARRAAEARVRAAEEELARLRRELTRRD